MKTKPLAKLAAQAEGLDVDASNGALGRVFDPPITRQAVHAWGGNVPTDRLAELKLRRPHWFPPKAKP